MLSYGMNIFFNWVLLKRTMTESKSEATHELLTRLDFLAPLLMPLAGFFMLCCNIIFQLLTIYIESSITTRLKIESNLSKWSLQ